MIARRGGGVGEEQTSPVSNMSAVPCAPRSKTLPAKTPLSASSNRLHLSSISSRSLCVSQQRRVKLGSQILAMEEKTAD